MGMKTYKRTKMRLGKNQRIIVIVLLCVLLQETEAGRVRHQSPATKQAMKFLKGIGVNINNKPINAHVGLWPPVLNLATKALITVNATCGEGGREEFCRLQDGPARNHFAELMGAYASGGGGGGEHSGRCGVCDNFSRDPHKRHPINYAIDDGSNRWWQSPPIHYGAQYEYVTITLDLKQVYQVVYVKLKAANAPRPGAWMLERSVDGLRFEPWQFFATSDKDCLDRYGLPARKGKPHYFTDSEVICTSYYSKLAPLENGEIYTLLVHGRPGANETSPELLEFTKARYVRFRFQGLRGRVEPLPARIAQDINRDKKLFYSIRDILIGGQCVCNGHASACRHKSSGNLECECEHNTCGPNCDHCCPLFNQQHWGTGTSRDAQVCYQCQCYGHASSCHYDEEIAQSKLSLSPDGEYKGGGVCDNCTKHTMGINCEKCVPGYYRPLGTAPDSDVPCLKCDCDVYGSTGECAFDFGGLTCQCREGYSGLRCDQCDVGFRGYPNCEQCPCNQRGTRAEFNNDCEGECVCKDNVEGKYCDRCKVGYFSLQATNPDGCSSCYCSGVTSVCASAYLQPKIYPFDINDKWLVSDISVKEIESPLLDDRQMLTVGNNEIIGIEAYYWLAPNSYTGNKLSMYGSNILYKVHWVVMRGDTSGKPTTGPNIILVGGNGMRIACGDESYATNNMTFLIPLDEYHDSWYHIPEDVDDIITRLRRTEYKGERVTRTQFMSVLNDLKHILLRAKFHTDQIEVSLEEVVIYSGNFTDGYSPVEECSCPSGYTGLSCELCQYGYVRVMGNNSRHETQGYCVKCDCNGHSESCDSDTGECKCEHNTIGERCERCAAGYYGNPLMGTPDDCKKCACPLVDDENNFSPSCQLDASSISNDDIEAGYVCTQCPKGYTGDHCEICDDGFFGVPSTKGGKCELCTCGGGPCDRLTGQCLSCRGNTEGWKCDRCKDAFFGSPTEGCEPCNCDSLGSTSNTCNNVTGECVCKQHFIGRTCNKCELGFGNVTAQCVECNCDLVGSTGNLCDQTTGMCECRPGVEGFRCDACQHLHYGFSLEGCTSCNCSLQGSELRTCNIVSGQCRCKSNYVGLTCDKCQQGFYEDVNGCKPCQCDADGSESVNCHPQTGQCSCKPGVEGPHCQQCKVGFYGFSKNGCKECEPCTKLGHICNQETGRCSCPPNSHGEYCDHCKPNHWGFEPNVGCKSCNCSDTGSIRPQCDLHSSSCICQQGYQGIKCDQCAHGYYGYPKCRRCSCHFPGTDILPGKCDATGVCQCDANGNCPCKSNVVGRRCNQCLEGTFGLHIENQEGCTECFCFGRSKTCTEAGYTWSKIRMKTRTFSVDFIDAPHGNRGQSPLFLDTNNFQEIESTPVNITTTHGYFPIPLFWRLPDQFTGDRILSYGGYLRFSTLTLPPPTYHGDFTQYPIARIEGNGIKLIHYSNMVIGDKYEIRLHESNWRLEKIHGLKEQMLPVTRDVLMVTLQRVTGIFIKATDYKSFESVLLTDVALDTGVHLLGSPPPLAMGVEKCSCPVEYNGTSCQNPSLGYHRNPAQPTNFIYHNTEDIDNVIGKSQPCSCQGRSEVCDIETGHCFDCADHTSGPSCEHCAEGYYGDPGTTGCKACACPSVTQNFALSCVPNPRANHVVCKCRVGYYGPTCDRCSPGYYGQPHLPGGSCKPCNCNVDGSRSTECDTNTGACSCKPGIVGLKCSECSQTRHILENNSCVLCDDCIQILLDDLDNVKNLLETHTGHLNNGTLHPPWGTLELIEQQYLNLSEKVDFYLSGKETLGEIIDNKETEQLEIQTDDLTEQISKVRELSGNILNATRTNKARSGLLLDNIDDTKDELLVIKKTLTDFATGQVSTKQALKKGHKLFQEIKKLRAKFNNSTGTGAAVRDVCKDTIRRVLELQNATKIVDFNDLKAKYDNLANRKDDFSTLLNNLHNNNEISRLKNKENKVYLESVQDLYKNAHEKVKELEGNIKQQNALIQDGKHKLNNTLIADYEEINDLLDQLEERIPDEFVNNLPDKRKILEEHVKELTKTAEEYRREFDKYDNDLKSLNASGKFKETNLDMIEYSRKTYEEAQADFDDLQKNKLSPPGNDTLFDKTAISKADSERLQSRISFIKELIDMNITQPHKRLDNAINDLKQLNWDNGLANNNASEQIHQMTFDKQMKLKHMKGIEDTIKSAVTSLEESRQIHKQATDLNITKKYNLDKSWEKYLNLTSAENINRFKNNLRFTKDLLRNVSNYDGSATDLDRLNQRKGMLNQFNVKRRGIDEKLQQLKNNILKAKQLASIIPIPLSGSDCRRRYDLNYLEPSTHFSLTMEFKIDSEDPKDLLRLYSKDNQDLLKINTADGKFYLKFADYDVKTFDYNWDVYTLTLNQTSVSLTPGGTHVFAQKDSKPRFYGTGYDWLDIGGETGLPGCLHELTINDRQIGLWDYEESRGTCHSCRVTTKPLPEQTYRFFGNSYFEKTGLGKSQRTFDMKITLRTFDENAMIFLLASSGYIAVTIENGHIRFKMQYKPEIENQIQEKVDYTTKQKYNNGNLTTILIAKEFNNEYDEVIFKVETQEVDEFRAKNKLKGSLLVKIYTGTFLIGGLSPTFDTSVLPQDFEKTPFLGTLSATLAQTTLSTERNFHHFNIMPFDGQTSRFDYDSVLMDKPKSVVSLEQIVKRDNERLNSVSFVVLVQKGQQSGSILKIHNDIKFVLHNEKLQLVVGDQIIDTNVVINDDRYHFVSIGADGCLYIDDEKQNQICKSLKFNVRPVKIVIGGNDNILGVVKEIQINSQNIYIMPGWGSTPGTYISHSGAKIGRGLPPVLKNINDKAGARTRVIPAGDEKMVDLSMKDITPPSLCESVATEASFEPNAFKFGHSKDSFIAHELKNGFWKGNYSIEFELRTFYPDGLLFLAHSNEHYNMFVIKEGVLELQMKGKKMKKITTNVRVDDGKWHHVVLENHHSLQKKKRRLALTVDGVGVERKMPQNRVSNKLYIGFVPKEKSNNYLVQQLRGCLRSVKFNRLSPNFFDDKKTRRNNVRQCFSNIERGSYFGGDSYAVYDPKFRLINYLDISLDFRTDQPNGILLSVSDSSNRPALSIELQNGAVVMSVDMGNGDVQNVTNNIVACNNKWHKVIASFTTELSINVDGVAQTWVLKGLEEMRSLEAPLYVGGLPDTAPGGTLKIRENLKGCIRNLLIDNKNVDWVDMHELKDVSLNSCPVNS